VLERTGLSVDDLGAIELNEAFATQSLAVMRELGLDDARVNADGGAIALGHPLGSSGSRLVVTLLGRMAREQVRYGLATMCVGVGQGTSLIVEREHAADGMEGGEEG
jgi:acetyl-CoA C-acetyltransferase